MAKSEDHYTRVAEQLIEKLKEGTAPWQQPWDAGGYGSRPMNPTTGKPYRGGNMLYLMMQGHGAPRWMTYRQAQSVGAQVRKGEKGTPIIYWKFEEERTVHGDNGKPVRDTDGNAVKEKVQLE
ncbi:ArdC-like ssDNA-binding domain-containing protein [Bilophila wadsworthia]|uniref:ArdC-like ssDNA-binding domain-containing protein n=1 Tax=Bilophila wadsworthia TaxID=35833 RepID=UPI003AF127B0